MLFFLISLCTLNLFLFTLHSILPTFLSHRFYSAPITYHRQLGIQKLFHLPYLLLKTGWEMNNFSAARPKCNSKATVKNKIGGEIQVD